MLLANPIQLTRGLKSLFIEQLASEPESYLSSIATYSPSDGDKETYSWLGEAVALDEFEDEVKYKSLSETLYELANKKYTAGMAVKRDDLADEKTGGIALRIRELAQRTARFPNKLLVDAVIAGTSALGYDGVEFFSATHPARGRMTATWSNIVSQTATTTAGCKTDISSAMAALANMKDEENEPLNEMFNQVFVLYPPALHGPIAEAVRAQTIDSTSNVEFESKNIQLISCPRLTASSASAYYVGIGDAIVRGLIFQDREAFTLESLETGEDSFTKEVYKYKVRGRCRAGYGRPQRLVRIA